MEFKPTAYDVGSYQYASEKYEETHGLLDSNWPFKNVTPKKRKYLEKTIYFVDSRTTQRTIGRFTDRLKAKEFARKINGVIRPYKPTDEEVDNMQAEAREIKRYGSTAPHKSLTATKRRKPRKIHSAN